MNKKTKSIIALSGVTIALCILFFYPVFAAHPSHQDETVTTEEAHSQVYDTEHSAEQREEAMHDGEHHDEGFDPGHFIIHHIMDAYEWHIFTYKDLHVAIPLPVIVYSIEKGWHIFLSSKFHKADNIYKGFTLAHEGEFSGKVIEIMEDGSVQRPFLDLSFTRNAFGILISVVILLLIFISAAKAYKKRKGAAPTGLQNLVEPFVIFIRDEIAIPSIGADKYHRFLPFLLSLFFFIFINNLLGLIPVIGGANVTGNITVTMVLALFTFFITNISGGRKYLKHVFNTPGIPWWMKIPIPLLPVIEIIGMLTKPFVLMVRLFANITAGHIIVLGFYSLIFIFGNMEAWIGLAVSPLSVLFAIFMFMLELLVALIQAYVFTLLSALYFGMAIEEAHH